MGVGGANARNRDVVINAPIQQVPTRELNCPLVSKEGAKRIIVLTCYMITGWGEEGL